MMKNLIFLLLPLGIIVGCKTIPTHHSMSEPPMHLIKDKIFATATLEPRSGSKVRGTAWFAKNKNNDDIQIVISLFNGNAGVHGIHIHEKGDCSAPDASSAGEHYNPTHLMHGSLDPLKFHTGDLGNITVDQTGRGVLNITIPSGHFHPDFTDWTHIVGKSVVLHSKADNFISQPSGDSGSRIACGVIKY